MSLFLSLYLLWDRAHLEMWVAITDWFCVYLVTITIPKYLIMLDLLQQQNWTSFTKTLPLY